MKHEPIPSNPTVLDTLSAEDVLRLLEELAPLPAEDEEETPGTILVRKYKPQLNALTNEQRAFYLARASARFGL